MAVQGKVLLKIITLPSNSNGVRHTAATKQVDCCLYKWLLAQVAFTYQYQLETQILSI
jgi:hypothetical protein